MEDKPAKILIVWPPTGRTMEVSPGAFERTYQPQGWTVAPAPPAPPQREIDSEQAEAERAEAERAEAETAAEPAKPTSTRRGGGKAKT